MTELMDKIWNELLEAFITPGSNSEGTFKGNFKRPPRGFFKEKLRNITGGTPRIIPEETSW